jgi:hypothetical protein
MNNTTTRTLALVAVFMAATLVVGTFATTTTTQPAFAIAKKPPGHGDKKTRDNGSGNGNGNTVTIEECKNRGSASGFDTTTNQECENLICTHPGENATCVQEGVGTTTTTPTKLTCQECLTKFLNAEQIFLVTQGNLEQFCATSPRGEPELQQILTDVAERTGQPIDQAGLIQCLKNAGIVFIGGGG